MRNNIKGSNRKMMKKGTLKAAFVKTFSTTVVGEIEADQQSI